LKRHGVAPFFKEGLKVQFDRCVSRGRLFSCILSALIILFTGVTPIHAATINVAADALDILDGLNGVCSLREAITNINNAGPTYGDCDETNTGGDYGTDDTINLPAGLYTNALPGVNEWFNATGDLDIYTSVTISGAGANVTTIDGGHLDSVFHLWGTAKVNISDLTVTHGATFTSSPDGGSGGGIRTQGQSVSLTFTNVTVNDNEAHNAGGIFVVGPVTLNNCTVSNNKALAGGFGGGGILNYINGPLILNNSTVSGNIGGFAGGIITTSHGSTLVLNNSTVAFNTGGLYNAAGTVYMKNTVLANGGGNCAFNAGVTLTSLG